MASPERREQESSSLQQTTILQGNPKVIRCQARDEGDDDQNFLTLLAVVEWEESHQDDKNHRLSRSTTSCQDCFKASNEHTTSIVVHRTKLRLYRRDIRLAVAVTTPELLRSTLRQLLLHDDSSLWPAILSKLVLDEIKKQETQYDSFETMQVEIYDSHQSDYVSLQLPSQAKSNMIATCRRQIFRRECSDNDDENETHVSCNGRGVPMLVRLRLQPKCSSANIPTSSTKRLAITGRYIPYHLGMDYAGSHLWIQEEPNGVGTGGTIWDGAMILAKYMESHPETVVSKSVLELGAGTGLVGIAAALLGAKEVLLTDLATCLPLLQENIDRHTAPLANLDQGDGVCHPRMACRALDWYQAPPTTLHDLLRIQTHTNNNDDDHRNNLHRSEPDKKLLRHDDHDSPGWTMDRQNGPDVIVIADCVWVEELVVPLLSTLEHLLCHRRRCSGDDTVVSTKVYISYQRRGKATHEAFCSGLQALFSQPHHRITRLDDPVWLTDARIPPDIFYLWECCYNNSQLLVA